MSIANILIVEDDGIIGHHIQNVLTKLGYHVVGIASSGPEAIALAYEFLPDLVLMDINLQGPMDGVDVAEEIHRKFDTPVIYLTAYADEKTLRRAKIADPFGYILKPFDERTLHATIVIALHKHDLELTLKESEARFRSLVHNQGEGLVIVDANEVFTFANPAANEIFGLGDNELEGHNMAEFTTPQQMALIQQQTNLRSLGEKNTYEIEIQRPDKEWRSLVVVATPWFDKDRSFVGTCAIMRDVTEQKRMMLQEKEQRALAEALRDISAALTSTLHTDEVLERILSNIDRVLSYDLALILLVEDQMAHVVGMRGAEFAGLIREFQGQTLPLGNLPTLAQLIESGEGQLIGNASQMPEVQNYPMFDWVSSYLGAPVIVDQKVTGFLVLMSRSSQYFSTHHLERLTSFADQAAIALKNARLYREAREQATYLALLNELTEIAIQSSTFPEMLSQMAERVGRLFKADGVYLTFWDEQQEGTVQGAAYGLNSEVYPRTTSTPHERTLTSSVLHYMQPLAVEDVLDTPYIDRQVAEEFPTRSMLGLPMLADRQKLGALLIGYKERHTFTSSEIEQGMQIARQAALAIIKGRLLETERERTRQLARANQMITALAHVAARIESVPAPQHVMETLVQELKNIGTLCVLSLKDETGRYNIRYSSIPLENLENDPELAQYSLKAIQTAFDQSPFYQRMIKSQSAQYYPNSQEFVTDLVGLKYPGNIIERILLAVGIKESTPMIFLPLAAGENEIGRMWLWGNHLEAGDLPTHTIFGSQVAVALENARLYAEVQTLAETDELTGLYNRRQIFKIALEEIGKAQQASQPLSLIIVDLDEFKAINDTYGHVVGDEVVVEVADRVSQRARKTDRVGRYGGDEFIILLPDTDLAAARVVAERMRAMVQDTVIPTSGGEVSITASLGVAALGEENADLVSLLIRADKSLYSAKRAGRNQVMAG